MAETDSAMPDQTAVRVALWRAIHAMDDPAPHVVEDKIGLRLMAPDPTWRERPDMDPKATRFFRASILARTRFIEDHVEQQANGDVQQYVIVGAGLDTFAQRRPEIASRMHVFEIDRPAHLSWKRQRLVELGYGIPEWLRLVPLDFEIKKDWRQRLEAAGFDFREPAVVASSGVSMYLPKDVTADTLRWFGGLASGSSVVMTFLLPPENAEPVVRPEIEAAVNGARASGTPFVSFFSPAEMVGLARAAGFKEIAHITATTLAERYFRGRNDGLRPPQNGEEIIVAST